MDTFDVIVVGLGAMGSATAHQLAARGQRVLGLEQYTEAHDRGSTHGGSRIIRLTLYKERGYVQLLHRARELWQELERESGSHLLTVTGGLAMGRPDHSVIEGGLRSAREFDLAYELLDPNDIRRRFPPFAPDPDMVGVFEPGAGYLDPEGAIRAFLGRAVAHGATIRFNEPVLRWEAVPSGGRVRVVTPAGVYEAGRLVITPGAWAPSPMAQLDLPFAITRVVMFWFDPIGGTTPFLPDRFPIYVCIPTGGERFYGFPAHHGPRGGAKVAFSLVMSPCTPETIDRVVREPEIEQMRAHLAQCLPTLAGPCLVAKTCLYTNTPDLNFVIGPHPAAPQCYVAAGFSGHGFKFASVIGEILADLAISGDTRHDIDLFSPTRFSTPAGAGVVPYV